MRYQNAPRSNTTSVCSAATSKIVPDREMDLRIPFGGMKQSGIGREGGDETLRFFTEPKNVCIKIR